LPPFAGGNVEPPPPVVPVTPPALGAPLKPEPGTPPVLVVPLPPGDSVELHAAKVRAKQTTREGEPSFFIVNPLYNDIAIDERQPL
jgi:hypothetical protein